MEELLLFDIKPFQKKNLTETEILDRIEFEFEVNKKNFWSTAEVAELFGTTEVDIANKIRRYQLDAIRIESLIKVPYNCLIDYVFYHKEWERQRKCYYYWVAKHGGKEPYDRLLRTGKAFYPS